MHPETKIYHLRKKDFERLLQERKNLQGAIRYGGTTIRSYTSQLGVDGRFQLKLKVHAKKGEACPVCRDEDQKDCRRNTGNLFLSDMPAQKMRTIGLTGVMGAGKSSVIRILQEEGITVLDCDAVNAQLLQKHEEGYTALIQMFGTDILNDEGNIMTSG